MTSALSVLSFANNRDNRDSVLDYKQLCSALFAMATSLSLAQDIVALATLIVTSLFHREEGGASQFTRLKLRAKPRKEDEAWSDWMIDGTRRSYSGARIRENCGAVSGTAGRLGKE